MASNLSFNQKLLDEAQKISGLKYKKDVIDTALSEYIQRHKQHEILSLFHTIPYTEDYDYKAGRKKR